MSLNSRPCQALPTLVSINSDESLFYLFTFSIIKCCWSCNTIDDPYARDCVLDKLKNINVFNLFNFIKAFNLLPGVNETRFLVH